MPSANSRDLSDLWLLFGVPRLEVRGVAPRETPLVAARTAGCRVFAVATSLVPAEWADEEWIPDFTGFQLTGNRAGLLTFTAG